MNLKIGDKVRYTLNNKYGTCKGEGIILDLPTGIEYTWVAIQREKETINCDLKNVELISDEEGL